MAPNQTNTGLPQSTTGRRWHFDIYAMVEAPQELYFGHETQVNVNVVETVRIDAGGGKVIEKCYMSPTKRRGVERRTLIWAPLPDGRLLGDMLGCGIPHTCTQPTCPICSVYGGLLTSDSPKQLGEFGERDDPQRKGKKLKDRGAATLIGRLTHGGGVAVQLSEPAEKQRALHPSILARETGKETKPTPTPFKREYNEPSLLYPIYNHALSVSEDEFAAIAYAFLDAQARLGAGNPKGVRFYESDLLGSLQPLIVLDRYLVPMGKRPTISPAINDVEIAKQEFVSAALKVHGENLTKDMDERKAGENMVFTRWIGEHALKQLQDYALTFAQKHLV